METNNLTIIPPEGMEAYQEGNEIKFRPIKKVLTYDDVCKELFFNKNSYYLDEYGNVQNSKLGLFSSNLIKNSNNCTSYKQGEKLMAINKLMNIAKYLNNNWQPNWYNDLERKYYLYAENNKLNVYYSYRSNNTFIYFKSEKLANQAIEILGKETIKLALSTDW